MIKITKELLSEWFDEVNKGLKKKMGYIID